MNKLILLLIWVCLPCFATSFSEQNSYSTEIRLDNTNSYTGSKSDTVSLFRDTLYDCCIEHIKKYESFSDRIYLDNDSSPTIGYGHHILKGENIPLIIDKSHADIILRSDFDKFIKIAEKYTSDRSKTLGLSMFLYNLGETKYVNSHMSVLIKNNKPIDDEIIKWVHFHKEGVKHTSNKLVERREFELKIYNL